MRKTLLTALGIAIQLSGFSQDIQVSGDSKMRDIRLGPVFSLNICGSYLRNIKGDAATDQSIEHLKKDVLIKPGMSIGIGLHIPFDNEKWSLQTGLQYSNLGWMTSKLSFSSGVNDPVNFRWLYNFNYLEVPTTLRRHLAGDGLKFNGIAGLSLGYLTNISITEVDRYENGSRKIKVNKGVIDEYTSRFNLFPILGAGIEKEKSRFLFRLEAQCRFGVIDLLKYPNHPLGRYLWSTGISGGLFYSL